MSHVRRRPCYTRRRTRSVGSIPFTWQSHNVLANHHTLSDELCSSSTSKDKDYSNFYQSDSDDICSGVPHNIPCNLMNMSTVCRSIPNNMESDSLNENSPCRRSTRSSSNFRKRKFKRIAMEVEMSASRFHPPSVMMLPHSKKKRIMRHSPNCHPGRLWLNNGKRKRSFREKLRPQIGDYESPDLGKDAKVLGISKLSLNDYPEESYNTMEVAYTVPGVSSSSLSSSGSETGIFTNDEGREGDDEQSDWVGDVGMTAPGLNFLNKKNLGKNEAMYFTYDLVNDVQPSHLDVKQAFKLLSPQGSNSARITRRKGHALKPNFGLLLSSDSKITKPIPEFVDHNFSKTTNAEGETKIIARRHTFSGYKRRKRIPQQSSMIIDTISEKSSQGFLPSVQKLSDISSSDSKDSIH